MRRVSVVGNSGSGKSTLALALASRLSVPHVELDAIFHQPGWQPLPPDEFRSRIAEVVVGDAWVVDGNYSTVLPMVWERADTVVWLDLPRALVMRRIVWRTLVRLLTRRELWNNNREPWRNVFQLGDRNQSVIAWAWTQHAKYHDRYANAMRDPRWQNLEFVRLCSDAEVEAFLRSLPSGGDGISLTTSGPSEG